MKFSEFKKNIDAGLKATLGTEETSDRVKNLEAILNIVNTINRSLIVDDVFLTGQSIFLEGAQSDTNYDPTKSILKLDLQTILCSPLITDSKKIGVIYVD